MTKKILNNSTRVSRKQIYYHFLSSNHAIHDLERKMIRVSTLGTLNDPFELLPYLRYKFEKRQHYHNVRKAIEKKWGLLCFSRSWQEPLLWSHYADKHKGIALGFEILKDKILKVDYKPDPIRKQIELTSDQSENEKLFFDLAKIKYQNWQYESEYRILLRLEDYIEIDGHYFIRFGDRLKVREIVLGDKYDNSTEYISELAKQLDAEVIRSRLEWQGYKIMIRGKKRS